MRKSYISILLAIIACFLTFAFVGCSKTTDNTDNIETITDIEFYADMQAGGDKIVVDYRNGRKDELNFTIEDKEDIDEIVNLILTSHLTNVGISPVAPGDDTDLTVYQGTKAYGLALSGVISNNNDRYTFSEINALREKINVVAREKGLLE